MGSDFGGGASSSRRGARGKFEMVRRKSPPIELGLGELVATVEAEARGCQWPWPAVLSVAGKNRTA
ncbi:hypothetical protein E2562_036939 [Oryza meyeriana var. granulata]|uniref:Uncharacterized protein n=1 Tax=Oryza meyeriana var. granulata TaxID=110450 RepID=A0A6G1CCN5_9ORYZ|nr:hypothetical protein E2562_036939 [Oryza meyeriana var. granulata]